MPREIRPGKNIPINQTSFQNLLLNSSAGFRKFISPSWDFTALAVRPLPIPESGKQSFTPFLKSEHPLIFGDWFGQDFLTARVSNGSKTAIYMVKHKDDGYEVLENSPTFQLSEYLNKFSLVLRNMQSGKQEYVEQAKSTVASFSSFEKKIWNIYKADKLTEVNVSVTAFMQGIPIVIKSQIQQEFVTEKRELQLTGLAPVIKISKSAIYSIIDVAKGTPDSPSPPDLIDLRQGAFLQISRYGTDTNTWYPTSGNKSLNYHQVRVFEVYDKIKPTIKFDISDKVTTWDRVFNLLSPEEELYLLLWAGISSVYIYAALVDKFKLPDRVISEAKTRLGITSVAITADMPSHESTSNSEDELDTIQSEDEEQEQDSQLPWDEEEQKSEVVIDGKHPLFEKPNDKPTTTGKDNKNDQGEHGKKVKNFMNLIEEIKSILDDEEDNTFEK